MSKFKFLNVLLIIIVNILFVSNICAFDDKNMISVKEYGAKGDGKTDDLSAIKEAINACDEQIECTVYFSSGSYIVNDSIVISKSNIRLLGDENVTIKFGGTSSDIDSKRIVGIIVVKTVDRDVSNVVVDNLIVDVGASETKYGKKDSLGRGITFIRQGKYKGTKNYYLMNDVKILNSTIKNSYSYGIATLGGEQLKDGYTTDSLNEIKNNYTDDFDNRLYYNYYDIDNLTISGCTVDKSRIGIRVNRVNNGLLYMNKVSNSRLENITIQGQNLNIFNNTLSSHNGGCGSLCIDKSENLKINNNNIDELNSTTNSSYKIGICHNSEAGPSYNIFIENNNINNASRGIWLKDHRLKSDSGLKQVAGSRSGAGFLIKDNIIEGSSITDIRIDELLDRRIDDKAYVGKSYLYNKYNNSINREIDSNSQIGSNISLDDNDNLVYVKPSIIRIAKVDKNGNYIIGAKLQISDIYGNVYDSFESINGLHDVDLMLGSYILSEIGSNDENVSFTVENDNYQKKYIYIIDKNNTDNKSKENDTTDDSKINDKNNTDNKSKENNITNDDKIIDNNSIDNKSKENDTTNDSKIIDNNSIDNKSKENNTINDSKIIDKNNTNNKSKDNDITDDSDITENNDNEIIDNSDIENNSSDKIDDNVSNDDNGNNFVVQNSDIIIILILVVSIIIIGIVLYVLINKKSNKN